MFPGVFWGGDFCLSTLRALLLRAALPARGQRLRPRAPRLLLGPGPSVTRLQGTLCWQGKHFRAWVTLPWGWGGVQGPRAGGETGQRKGA